jgi:hypothetical protein
MQFISRLIGIGIVANLANLFLAQSALSNPLETLQRSYSERVGTADAEHDHRLERLAAGYIAALERQIEVTQRGGNLEEVLILKQEIEALKAPKPVLQELPQSVTQPLRKLRETYQEAVATSAMDHAAKRVHLADRMAKALKDLEVQQTKDGKIEVALATRMALKELAEDPEVMAARKIGGDGQEGGGPSLAEWRSLTDSNMRITEQGIFPVGWLSGDLGAAAVAVLPQMQRIADDKPALVSVPNAAIEFRTSKPFRKLRFRAYLAVDGGDVEFRVSVKGKLLENFTLKERSRGRDIELEFGPTQVVELSVFDNGSPNNDWAMWIDPQVQ